MGGTPAAPAAVANTDKFPSGSWGFGPLAINWDLKAGNEVDVDLSVLGLDIDSLSGTLSSGNAQLTDTLNILNIVKGTITLDAKYGATDNTNGLYVMGDLTGPGFHYGPLNHRIISW
jgi:hypothetical protein